MALCTAEKWPTKISCQLSNNQTIKISQHSSQNTKRKSKIVHSTHLTHSRLMDTNTITDMHSEWSQILTHWPLGDLNEMAFRLILLTDGWGTFCKTALMRLSLDLTDDKSPLVQVMAWCLFGARPLPETMLSYHQSDPPKETFATFESKYDNFDSRKCIGKCLQNGHLFV